MASARLALAAVFLCLGSGISHSQNLIKNGSFEKPIVPNASYIEVSTGATFGNWIVVGDPGNVTIVSTNFTQNGFTFSARKGSQWLDLTGTSNTATGVAQTVATTEGQDYLLSFYVGNAYDPEGIQGTRSQVRVLVNGAPVLLATNRKGQGTMALVWKKFTTTIIADSSSTTISFINEDPVTDTKNGIDSVVLVPSF